MRCTPVHITPLGSVNVADHIAAIGTKASEGGKPIQYIHYAPYGELIANQQTIGYDERFKFTGKERDWETGYDYFGARFYDHRKGIWNSVDPLADKYPNVTPYLYCNGNPIMLVDPDGRKIVILGLDGKKTTYCPKADYEYGEIDLYTKMVISQLNQLFFDDPSVQNMIIGLHESEFTHEIKAPEAEKYNSSSCNREKSQKHERQGSTIAYNPYEWSTVNGDIRNPRCGLAHELAHSEDADQGTLPSPDEKVPGTSIRKSEVKAVNIENKIRKKTGDVKRTKYAGQEFPTGVLDD